eukprot:1672885-Lingulodinium_polyedra.AAC.1
MSSPRSTFRIGGWARRGRPAPWSWRARSAACSRNGIRRTPRRPSPRAKRVGGVGGPGFLAAPCGLAGAG